MVILLLILMLALLAICAALILRSLFRIEEAVEILSSVTEREKDPEGFARLELRGRGALNRGRG